VRFRSLRLRLLASHIIVLLLTLGVMSIALFVLLWGRPFSNVSVASRLATQLTSVLGVLDSTETTLAPDGPTRTQERQLTTIAISFSVRVLIRNAAGVVIYDSVLAIRGDHIRPDTKIDFKEQPYPLPGSAQPNRFISGTFLSPKGSQYVYVAEAPTDKHADAYLLLATIAPKLTTDNILSYYGSDFLVPLVQAGLIGLLIAFVFSFIIARSVAQPLRDVAETAHAIASGQDERKAPVAGPTEVRTLAEAFNQMLDRVRNSQRAQRDFLANVSHDLRTPLTSIQGFSQAIIEGVATTPEAAARAATIIHAEAERMGRMVQDLLDLARIEGGRMEMAQNKIQIGDLVKAVAEKLSLAARDKGLTLTTEIAPALPVLSGDGDRLAQVFNNLIDNALKHTPPGGVITVSVCAEESASLVTIHDTGEGIPAADLPHIFERFYQVDKSRQRRDGAGIGLQISYQIVQAHGGRIWAESEEGAWTRFNVWLPTPPQRRKPVRTGTP